MPPPEIQQPSLHEFHKRVAVVLREAAQREEALSKPQAEQQVWQEIEEHFLTSSKADTAFPT